MSHKVYLDACCFIELACHKVGTHKKEREEDIRYLDWILKSAFAGEVEVYTAILSVAECQCAYNEKGDARIITDDIKQLFKDLLMSGQFVVLVQDSVLVAEKARNLSWVHDLTFSGADAIHIASALEMGCDEFITFDGRGPMKRAKELEDLALTVIRPKETKCLIPTPKPSTKQAVADKSDQDNLFAFIGENDEREDQSKDQPAPTQLSGGSPGSPEDQTGAQAATTQATEPEGRTANPKEVTQSSAAVIAPDSKSPAEALPAGEIKGGSEPVVDAEGVEPSSAESQGAALVKPKDNNPPLSR